MNELARSIGQSTLEKIQTRQKPKKQEKIIDNPHSMLYNIIINNERKINKVLVKEK